MSKQIGGSFAPPLSDEKLAVYQELINLVPEKTQLREALDTCMKCVKKWWELPESSSSSKPHGSGRGALIELDDSIKSDLWDLIPWKEEIETIKKLFDEIKPNADTINPITDRVIPNYNRDLRNAAYHLLWHVVELDLDREPITNDKI